MNRRRTSTHTSAAAQATRYAAYLLLVLFLATAVSQMVLADLPTPPPIPGPPDASSGITLLAPAAGATVATSSVPVQYRHSKQETLYCIAVIDSASWSDTDPRWNNTQLTKYAEVAAGATQQETFTDVADGTHAIDVYCSDFAQTYLLHSMQSFTVSTGSTGTGGANVVILAPQNTTFVNTTLQYKHTASTSGLCTVLFDGVDVHRSGTVRPGETRTEQFSGLPLGSHQFAVSCINDTWSASSSRTVQIIATPSNNQGLTVTPSTTGPGKTVTITGTFPAYATVAMTVTAPDATTQTWNVQTGTSFSTSYSVPSQAVDGQYTVSAATPDGASATGTFTVISGPALSLRGQGTVMTGTSFSIDGQNFGASDVVQLSLSGAGVLRRNSTRTDASGALSYTFGALSDPGTYVVSATSVNAVGKDATLSVIVVGPSISPPANTGTGNQQQGPPTIGTGNQNVNDINNNQQDTVNTPAKQEPTADNPLPTTKYPTPAANTEQPQQASSGSWWTRLLIFGAVFLVLLGGTAAYLAHNGSLDFSSTDALFGSVRSLFGSGLPAVKLPPIDPAQSQMIKAFIIGERGKNFDDLTIRSALLAKGWEKSTVDRTFDAMYREQKK